MLSAKPYSLSLPGIQNSKGKFYKFLYKAMINRYLWILFIPLVFLSIGKNFSQINFLQPNFL